MTYIEGVPSSYLEHQNRVFLHNYSTDLYQQDSKMLPTIFAATLALIAGTNAVAVAQGAAQPESELINGNRKVCAFDETLGPSLLVASVKYVLPSPQSS